MKIAGGSARAVAVVMRGVAAVEVVADKVVVVVVVVGGDVEIVIVTAAAGTAAAAVAAEAIVVAAAAAAAAAVLAVVVVLVAVGVEAELVNQYCHSITTQNKQPDERKRKTKPENVDRSFHLHNPEIHSSLRRAPSVRSRDNHATNDVAASRRGHRHTRCMVFTRRRELPAHARRYLPASGFFLHSCLQRR